MSASSSLPANSERKPILLLSLIFLIVSSRLLTRVLIEREICRIKAKITTKTTAVMTCFTMVFCASRATAAWLNADEKVLNCSSTACDRTRVSPSKPLLYATPIVCFCVASLRAFSINEGTYKLCNRPSSIFPALTPCANLVNAISCWWFAFCSASNNACSKLASRPLSAFKP